MNHVRGCERLAIVLDLGAEDAREAHQQVRRIGHRMHVAHQQKTGRIGERAGQCVGYGFRGGDDRMCAIAAAQQHDAAEPGAGKWFLEFQAAAHPAPAAMDTEINGEDQP